MSELQDTITVTEPAQVRLLADPIRRAILSAFSAPKSTKQVATELGVQGTKLYHHVDALEAAGFLKLIETRPKRGTVERILQVTAKRFVVQLGAGGADDILHSHLADFEPAKRAGLKPFMAKVLVKIDPKNLGALESVLTEAVKSLQDENGQPVSVLLMVCPLVPDEPERPS